jgi:peptide/nickel transport system substrate-binding protein
MKRVLFVMMAVVLIGGLLIIGCSQPSPTQAPSPAAAPVQSSAAPAVTAAKPAVSPGAPGTSAAPATSAAPTASSSQPTAGGTLKLLTDGSVVRLGYPPLMGSAYELQLVQPAVETLIGLDDKGIPIPNLAESWEVTPDKKAYIIKLKKGVKFHDGTDFNAQAVKFDLEDYKANKMADLAQVSSIDMVDDYTVRLNLTAFDSTIPASFASYAGLMISANALKTNGKDWSVANPVGTGPFKFVSWNRDVSLKYAKFDGYWQKGKPYLDGIDITFIADPTTASAALQKGEGNLWTTQAVKEASDLKNTGKFTVSALPSVVTSVSYDSANADSPLAKLKVRQAVGYAIDWDTIAKTYGYGLFKTINQMAAPGTWGYNPNITGTPYDPVKAKQLMAEAGYPNGFKTKIIALISGMVVPMFTAIQGYVKPIGIDAQLETNQMAAYLQYMTQGWSNAMIFHSIGVGPGTDTPMQILKRHSKGVYMSSVDLNDQIRSKLVQATQEADFAKKQALTQEAMKNIIDDQALVSSGVLQVTICVSYPQVKDTKLNQTSSLWTPANAWLSK